VSKKILGISGKSASGKTTFADLAVKEFGATKLSFASSLKEEVAEFLTKLNVAFEPRHLYGVAADKEETFIVEHIEWEHLTTHEFSAIFLHHMGLSPCGKFLTLSYRPLMQLWGTEYRRAQDEAYWTKKLQERVQSTEGLIVIDDVRFKDEAEMIEDLGGTLIRAVRGHSASKHPSETELDDFNRFSWMIQNYEGLPEYENEVRRCLGVLL